jgi:hypothetical protein
MIEFATIAIPSKFEFLTAGEDVNTREYTPNAVVEADKSAKRRRERNDFIVRMSCDV